MKTSWAKSITLGSLLFMAVLMGLLFLFGLVSLLVDSLGEVGVVIVVALVGLWLLCVEAVRSNNV